MAGTLSVEDCGMAAVNSDEESHQAKFEVTTENSQGKNRDRKYGRLLQAGFVLSVTTIITGVILHIIEYAMRANAAGNVIRVFIVPQKQLGSHQQCDDLDSQLIRFRSICRIPTGW